MDTPAFPAEPDPIVCFCFSVHQSTVLAAIAQPGVETVLDITARCKAGNGCSSCWSVLEELITLRNEPTP